MLTRLHVLAGHIVFVDLIRVQREILGIAIVHYAWNICDAKQVVFLFIIKDFTYFCLDPIRNHPRYKKCGQKRES